MARKKFFSGIQPTGEIHIGNYLGAIQRWVELANSTEYDGILCIVDYHAITVPYATEKMMAKVQEAAMMIMACGINPDNSLLFIQSHVPEHTELAWIFNCLCTMGELGRMTQFKDKSKGEGESVSVGLFDYPVLQVADILLYKAECVPVGEDQLQHLELSREIARRFNKRYGDTFPEPQPILGEARRILGTDGEKKMSKSLDNSIALADSPKDIWKKLAVAKTDVRRQRRCDPGIPTDCNVFMSYHRYFSPPEDLRHVDHQCRNAGFGCIDCKKLLVKNMEPKLAPIRERYQQLKSDPTLLREFLSASSRRCREMAQETMTLVRKRIGLR